MAGGMSLVYRRWLNLMELQVCLELAYRNPRHHCSSLPGHKPLENKRVGVNQMKGDFLGLTMCGKKETPESFFYYQRETGHSLKVRLKTKK